MDGVHESCFGGVDPPVMISNLRRVKFEVILRPKRSYVLYSESPRLVERVVVVGRSLVWMRSQSRGELNRRALCCDVRRLVNLIGTRALLAEAQACACLRPSRSS